MQIDQHIHKLEEQNRLEQEEKQFQKQFEHLVHCSADNAGGQALLGYNGMANPHANVLNGMVNTYRPLGLEMRDEEEEEEEEDDMEMGDNSDREFDDYAEELETSDIEIHT